MATSLHGMVNFNFERLETVLDTILNKLESQHSRIEVLEKAVSANALSRPYESVQKRLDESLNKMEQRFQLLEEKVEEGWVNMSTVPQNSRKVRACLEALVSKADVVELEEVRQSVSEVAEEKVAAFKTELYEGKHFEIPMISKLEDAQHRLICSVDAMERLLLCKIDRAEVPLLDNAVEKMNSLLEFRDHLTPRVERVEEVAAKVAGECQRLEQQKESKEAIVQRMQHIHQFLSEKSDLSWVQEHVQEPMKVIQNDVTGLTSTCENLANLAIQQEALLDRTAGVEDKVVESFSELGRIQSHCMQTLELLEPKAEVEWVEEKSRRDAQECKRWITDSANKMAEEGKVQAAYLNHVQEQLSKVKSHSMELEQKVGVALRFVEWFSAVHKA